MIARFSEQEGPAMQRSPWSRFIHPVTRYFRHRRGAFLRRSFPDIDVFRICDLGGSRHYWEKIGLAIPSSNIVIYNIEGEECVSGNSLAQEIRYEVYDGEHLPVRDKYFDLLICNSVIEHVALEKRAAIVREMRRVAKRIFLQTPSFWFPIEPHFVFPFLHWFPSGVGSLLVLISPWRILSKPSAETISRYYSGTRLLSGKDVRRLFPDGTIYRERFLGITKSFYVVVTD